MPEYEIRVIAEDESARWDSFVYAHALGSPFHLCAWRNAISKTFNYTPYYLAAWQGRRICGVLPLFLVENLLIGKSLISSPFAVYGGILSETTEARDQLRAHAMDLGAKLRVDYIEFRNAHSEQCSGVTNVRRYVNFSQTLCPEEDELLAAIPRKTRAAIRKSLKQGFDVRSHRTNSRAFEQLYSENLRRLGTPSFSSKHFRNLLDAFGKDAEIREVLLEGKVVAAVMSFYFRDQVLPYYGASDPDYNDFGPNNFMYFDQMRWAGQKGFLTFDFGRSKPDTGSYHFKAHWGMREKQLPYEIILIRRKSMPDFSPKNVKFTLPIRVWQHLPLAITRFIGPTFVRLVP